jgi:alkylation response protein AidB-like acyl-CoA dehydrogenase
MTVELGGKVDFGLTQAQLKLQRRCRELAADFATRAAAHDRDASHPIENYDILRSEGFLELTVPKKWGGAGYGFLDHTIAFEALGQGCPSTALAFNMHASVVMPALQSPEVTPQAKHHVADLVVNHRKLIGGNFSEPGTTSLIGERPLAARARRLPNGGYSITGRKMFASMIEAADYCMVMAYPDEATGPYAGIILLVPPDAAGRRVNPNWDALGMRATRSDALILEDCRLPDDAVVYRSDDIRQFRLAYFNWFWGSYTSVYLGVAQAAYDELRRTMQARRPEGLRPAAYLPPGRAPSCRRIECRSRSGAADHLPLGLAQRQRGADPGNHCRAVPRQIHGRPGGEPDHPGCSDPRRRARHLQRLAARTIVPRRRNRRDPAAAGGFLPLHDGTARAGAGPGRDIAADETGLNACQFFRCTSA